MLLKSQTSAGPSTDFGNGLHELADRSLLPADSVAVMVVGSSARGWANKRSDYDLYVITEAPLRRAGLARKSVPLQPSSVLTDSYTLDGRRREIKYWTDAQVDQIFAKVTWDQFENSKCPMHPLSEPEESFLERLFTAKPLRGADWVAHRRAELAGTAFQAFLVTRSLSAADACIEDVLGQLDDDDLESAVLSARGALRHTVDALLESRGHYGSQIHKWQARRFREAGISEVPFERYWRLQTMEDFDAARPQMWIDQVITFCKEVPLIVEI
jgi:hypothetical protein